MWLAAWSEMLFTFIRSGTFSFSLTPADGEGVASSATLIFPSCVRTKMALPICQIDASHNRTKTRRFSMRLKNSQTRYGAPAIALHWLMLLLLIAVYACMELRGIYPKGSALRDGIKTWHYMLGLSVFGLVWLRLAFALIGTTPDIKPAAPKWQMRLALAMKVALYAFMIGMPLLGWLLLSAEGKPMPSFLACSWRR
ncbi:MAG: hypothetical protein ACI83P_002224 [Janthinobacterium sp.]|jgi:hypothetical protein